MGRSTFRLLWAFFLGSLLFSSCKKDQGPRPGPDEPGDTAVSLPAADEDSLKYLLYNIMQVSFRDGGRDTVSDLPTYYWYDQVPRLDPLSSQYATADDLLKKITSYPRWNGNAVDRYSFLDRAGDVANEIQNGIVGGVFGGLGSQGDLGLEISYAQGPDGKVSLMVLYADRNSPAGQKGIRRGWQIIAVNGNDDLTYDGPDGKNVNAVYSAIYEASQAELTFKKPDNTTVTYTLTATPYDLNPILFDTIYVRDNKKIGYFVFYTFSSVEDDNGNPTKTKQLLDQEFQKLKTAGIRDLIVDLRYNAGGAVTTAAYLDNAIAPASADGQVMYRYAYNDKLSENLALLGMKDQVDFTGAGGLNLDHVFFITTRNTASASELTINNLKAYMKVKIIGDTTYGKPVGFIDFEISDYDSLGKENRLADLYAINFATRNADGVGEYYDGLALDEAAQDFIDIPWGDPEDDNLSKILNFIATGSFGRAASGQRLKPAPGYSRLRPPAAFPSLRFHGMIDYRLSRKVQPPAQNR